MTQKQREAITILNKVKDCTGEQLTEEEYITLLEVIWDSEMKPIKIEPYPFVPSPYHTYPTVVPYPYETWVTTNTEDKQK